LILLGWRRKPRYHRARHFCCFTHGINYTIIDLQSLG
jgi:hypothetical protein